VHRSFSWWIKLYFFPNYYICFIVYIIKLQSNSPVSVGQQSVIGLDIRSDIYLEKVNRWMESNIYENNCDNFSMGVSDMLHEIVHDKDINESYFSISQCITNRDALASASNDFPSSRCSSISRDQLTNAKTKSRVLSTDSGVNCACHENDGGKEHDATMTHVTVIQHHQPLLEAAENAAAIHGGPQPIVNNIGDIAKGEYSELRISDDSDNGSTTENSHCGFEQDTNDSLPGYTGGLSHYFIPEASKEREDNDEHPYIQNNGGCIKQQFNLTINPMIMMKDNNSDTCSEITEEVEQTDSYFGLDIIQSGNAKSSELTWTVSVGDYIHQTSVETNGEDLKAYDRYKSTMETGEYIELEAVHQSRVIMERDFDDELDLTVEIGNYTKSNVFDDSKEELESEPSQWFSLKENKSKLVNSAAGVKSTDAEQSTGDLSIHESTKLCQCVKHCNSLDSKHSRSPDPVNYILNDDGYIINQL